MKTDKSNSKIFQYGEVLHTYGTSLSIRYQCNCCHETFTEEIPFKYPGTRITYRAANWIKGFLQQKMSIKAIQELTGIHWDTIRKVQREIMDEAIWKREKMLREEGYKPRILAVDDLQSIKDTVTQPA